METFAAAGTADVRATPTQFHWGIPTPNLGTTEAYTAGSRAKWPTAKAAAGATFATLLATMPPIGQATPLQIIGLPMADAQGGTTAPGGVISYASRGLGSGTLLSQNRSEMAKILDFMIARPAADLVAIAQMHTMATQSFASAGAAPSIDVRVEEEPDGPALFMSVDTHGMDFDEQMRRELAMREAIWADARLQAAKNYVVISVF